MKYITQEMNDVQYLNKHGHWEGFRIPKWAQAMLDANPDPGYNLVLAVQHEAPSREIQVLQHIAQAFMDLHPDEVRHVADLSKKRFDEIEDILVRLFESQED